MENNQFSTRNRNKIINEMSEGTYDLLVIGGGISGAGIALDAATRGLKVALIEMQDFASGTSSRSTKLVHGGLRYLKQLEVGLVADVGKERAIVYENGPHVTKPEEMMLPIHVNGSFGKFSTSLGLKVYDFLARVKKAERRKMLSKSETLQREPLIKEEGLKASGCYVEYRTDDARLTLEVIKAAVFHEAKVLNYVKVTNLLYKEDQVAGAVIEDQLSTNLFNINAKKVVNATGPWVDDIRKIDQVENETEKNLLLTKGAHIVIDQSHFPLKQSVYFDAPDGRMLFAIPRENKVYVGTTDTFYQGDKTEPVITEEEIDYILSAIGYMFPSIRITVEQIESNWAGIRPLIHEKGKNPSEISRKDEIWQSSSGLVTIAGGKLTGYRKMAEKVIDFTFPTLQVKSQTKSLPISGGDVGGADNFQNFKDKKLELAMNSGLTEDQSRWLVDLYGSNVDTLLNLETKPSENFKLPADIYLSVVYGIQYEMTATPIDYFMRRTSALLFDVAWVKRWKNEVIACMAYLLNWTDAEMKQYKKELEQLISSLEQPTSKIFVEEER
ncbi:glycerol-3-phosphate dehydrogenase/oxidase [Halalkalibacillus halophilus]|uniref:glycerol-3-phosphate dehydrogenase/oxidase n=1 Tax=Halalkalibacillus halophilus TaxID=392827 RepID=UPI000405AB84|nr:glycerol-3-phosphate dehydrogenase/oxidase [Halalkalibacillus halophilus]